MNTPNGMERVLEWLLQRSWQAAVLVGVGSVLASCLQAVGGPTGADQIEQFKHFMESPPPVEEFVFRFHDVDLSHNRESDRHSTNYYECRWQTNGFMEKEMGSLAALDLETLAGKDSAAGYYGKSYWLMEPDRTEVFEADDPLRLHEEVRGLVESKEYIKLSAAFAMGLNDVRIGTVRWKGDAFKVNRFHHPDWRMEGKLLIGDSGRPEISLVTLSGESNVINTQVIQYEFGCPDAPAFVPRVIKSFIVLPEGNALSAEITVISLKLSSKLLPARAFAPTQFKNQTTDFNANENGKMAEKKSMVAKRDGFPLVLVAAFLVLGGLVYLLCKGAGQGSNEVS